MMAASNIQAGDIMWLRRNSETEAALGSMDSGALDHPVLVLGNLRGTQRLADASSDRDLQIVIVCFPPLIHCLFAINHRY